MYGIIVLLTANYDATCAVAPTGAPRDVVPSTTSRSVSVSWDAIDCIERNGVITGYTVEFQEQGGARIPGEVMNQTFTTSGLTPHTNYTFRVAGVNGKGTGPFSTHIITTNEDGVNVCLVIYPKFNYSLLVPGAVSNFMADPMFTSVLLTWNPPQEPNGVIIVYEVSYSTNRSELIVQNTTNVTLTLRLALSTEVSNISVRAYTSVGPGESSVHLRVSTFENLNPREFKSQNAFTMTITAYTYTAMVNNVNVKQLTDTSVEVSWTPINANEIIGYTVYYRSPNSNKEVFSSENAVVIEDLISGIKYQLEVKAKAEFGDMIYEGLGSLPQNITLVIISSPSNKNSNIKKGFLLSPFLQHLHQDNKKLLLLVFWCL